MSDARAAIERLLTLICERRDEGDFEGMAALFAHATFHTEYPGAPDGHGTQQGAAEVLDAFRTMVVTYENGRPRTQYLTTNTSIDIDEHAGTATAHSYFLVMQAVPAAVDPRGVGFPLQPVSSGRYHDRFERVDGEWRIVDRRIFADQTGDRSRHMRVDPLDYGREFRSRRGER